MKRQNQFFPEIWTTLLQIIYLFLGISWTFSKDVWFFKKIIFRKFSLCVWGICGSFQEGATLNPWRDFLQISEWSHAKDIKELLPEIYHRSLCLNKFYWRRFSRYLIKAQEFMGTALEICLLRTSGEKSMSFWEEVSRLLWKNLQTSGEKSPGFWGEVFGHLGRSI